MSATSPRHKIRLNQAIADIKDAQALVIAVKPQMMSEALRNRSWE